MKDLPEKKLVFPTTPLPAVYATGADYLAHDPFYGPTDFPTVLIVTEFYFAKILVSSDPCIVTCIDDYPGGDATVIGDSVEIAAGRYAYWMYPSDVEGMTNQELRVLSELPQEELNDMVGKTAEELQQAPYFLRPGTATILSANLSATLVRLNTIVQNMAESYLQCYWLNVRKTAECPPNTTGYENKISVVDAGTIKSFVSQQAADDEAQDLANAKLYCLFGNAEITATCAEKYTVPPGEDPATYPYRNVKGDPVTVPANKFTASTQLEADRMATEYVESLLRCYWENESVIRTCSEAVLNEYTDDEKGARTVLIETGDDVSNAERGLIVSIYDGVFVSTVSYDDVMLTAVAVAESLLDCKWESKTTEVFACTWYREDGIKIPHFCEEIDPVCYVLTNVPTCTVPDFNCVPLWTDRDGCYVYEDVGTPPEACALLNTIPQSGYLPPADCVPLDWNPPHVLHRVVQPEGEDETIMVPRGYAISYTNQQDANKMAELRLRAEVECIYCNLAIASTCKPPGLIEGFDKITGLYSDGTEVQPPFSEWAMNATLGLDAKFICGPDYLSVLARAQSLALRTYGEVDKSDADFCLYGNSELRVGCIDGVHTDGVRIHGMYDSQTGARLNPDGTVAGSAPGSNPLLFLNLTYMYPKLSDSPPYVVVPANTFTITRTATGGLDPKVYANKLAIAYGLSIINCPLK